jgi:hypothetical protein
MFDPNGYNYWNNTPASPNWNNTASSGWSGQSIPNTNIYKVISLDEAIMKSNVRNSEMIYFHQNKDEFYCIRVDVNGNKTWQVFTYNVPNVSANIPVMKSDYDALVVRLEAIENKLKEVNKVEPNEQNTVQ